MLAFLLHKDPTTIPTGPPPPTGNALVTSSILATFYRNFSGVPVRLLYVDDI
jgi:hypothetical protein